jgi:alkanesulfonate monooxygenase SsuD/methylene tetrahydromethanopterin reductase-like flavin-dependent oxidoreductase (luciferase family)
MTQPPARHNPLFGVSVEPAAEQVETIFEVARIADDHQLDLLAVQDHPYIPDYLDAWTLLVALATSTNHISVMPMVINLPLRTPAIVAKAAATLSLLSGGRIELGVGAGIFADGIEAYGGPRRTPGETVDAFEEAVTVMRALWDPKNEGQYEGHYYYLRGSKSGPPPTNPIRIWAGAYGPRMLRLTGAICDGWTPSNTFALPEKIPEMQRMIDSGAHGVGRDPAQVRRLYNLMGIITDAPETRDDNWLVTTPQGWVDALVGYYRDLGLDSFVFWPPTPDAVNQTQRFVTEVVPQAKRAISELLM